ncbi:MAG: ABC transporter ATP-binding protein [Clostridia bacterium]|nr:ABC transporter ATP-binding protein [Clostridia bacterium]
MLSEVVLRVKNLTKKFGNRVAVDNISFDVFEGEIFGFLGPNGAGKTTAIKMITGLSKPDSGNVLICGKSIKTQFEKAILNVGGIIENPEMYKNLSGLENLKYFAGLYKNVDKKRIDEVVEIVGLSDRIKDKVRTYSLGMKQRLGIAQALLHRPKLLILDEPTNGLDPSGVIEMRRFLKKTAIDEGIGIVISSHNLSEMELMCDSIGIINSGRLEKIRAIDQLKEYNENQQVYLKVNFPNFAGKLIMSNFNPEKISIIKDTLTINISHDKIPEITSLLVSNGIAVYSATAVVKTLEDVFLDTVNRRALPAPKNN